MADAIFYFFAFIGVIVFTAYYTYRRTVRMYALQGLI